MSTQAFSGNWGAGLGGLFWMKVSGDLVMKTFLGIFHLSILSSALGDFGQEFGDLPAVGFIFDALGVGGFNLGTIISLALTLVFLAVPPAAWYLYEKNYEPDFWSKPSPNRLILISTIVLYSTLLCVELSILSSNIMASAALQQNPSPFPLLDDEQPASPFIQGSLALLVTALGVVMGFVTSRLIQQVEIENLLLKERN